ncbi:MAG: hypothetical protein KAR20_20975 [Candidatus Heimdallarchaeota archaeon]|nr:hypothetical protein [Candidatus Heimdallarchaeota archaeon]
MQYVRTVDDQNDILCPFCNEVGFRKEIFDKLDYMDGESLDVNCDCGKRFTVLIDRPLNFDIFENAENKN